MKILIIGATGQLGQEICRSRLPSGTRLIAASRTQLDLSRPREIGLFINEIAPDLVINAAAYTAVDDAETERETALAVNCDGAAALAEAAAEQDAPIVHVSTDYVFDGSKEGAWTEDDEPSPLNYYGETKLRGERAVAAANPRHLILRTSWVYAANGQNFLRTMLRLARPGNRLSIVDDQFGRPTAAGDLAEALLAIVGKAVAANDFWGTYHVSNSGTPVSWHGFATAIFAQAASWCGPAPLLEPISTKAFGAPAPRPRNSVLDLGKIERCFGIKPRPWELALRDVIEELRLTNAPAGAS